LWRWVAAPGPLSPVSPPCHQVNHFALMSSLPSAIVVCCNFFLSCPPGRLYILELHKPPLSVLCSVFLRSSLREKKTPHSFIPLYHFFIGVPPFFSLSNFLFFFFPKKTFYRTNPPPAARCEQNSSSCVKIRSGRSIDPLRRLRDQTACSPQFFCETTLVPNAGLADRQLFFCGLRISYTIVLQKVVI